MKRLSPGDLSPACPRTSSEDSATSAGLASTSLLIMLQRTPLRRGAHVGRAADARERRLMTIFLRLSRASKLPVDTPPTAHARAPIALCVRLSGRFRIEVSMEASTGSSLMRMGGGNGRPLR